MLRTVVKRQLDKELRHTIEKRNKRLASFFENLGLEVEIIGDMETPAVIKENFCLSCYVHNFNLIFTNHYDQGEEVYRVKLQKEQEVDVELVKNWLESATHRQIFKVKMKDRDLYIVGYNFHDPAQPENKFPVFGKYVPKIFFTRAYAEELIELYQLDYCEIV